MKEASKAHRRRMADTTFPWEEIFQGWILDVGCADDILPLPNTIGFNLPDGGGDDLTKFYPPNSFQVVTGSQVLEHMRDPVVALHSWLKVVKPGGYIVFTCPDLRTYEGMRHPSIHNAGHRSTWSMDIESFPASPVHCKLPEWLTQFTAKVLRCQLILTNYDTSLDPVKFDQTFEFERGTECSVEVVLKK